MSSTTPLLPVQQASFQFKASFSPCTILQLLDPDLERLARELQAIVARAPNLFQGAPVILDLEKIKTSLDFTALKQLLIDMQLAPMGVRGGFPALHEAARSAGLPIINVGKNGADKTLPTPKAAPIPKTLLLTHPIRSGMQVYAKDADLIITASVSAGAELMADGNIHIYGHLRGRALAGMSGDQNARIFCRHFAAELVSIGGFYLTKEEMPSIATTDMVQIYLENEQVKFAAL